MKPVFTGAALTPTMRTLSQLLRAVLIGALLLTASFAAEESKKSYDIPAGDAAAALKQFSATSGRETLFAAEVVRGVKTPAVRGELSVQEALDALLTDTGLVATVDEKSGAIAVRRETTEESKNDASRLADAETADAQEERSGRVEDGVLKLGRFDVFGSKLINLDVPRTRDDVQPYVVFDAAQIQNSQATNLEDFLQRRLPMVSNIGSSSLSRSLIPASSIRLRGLDQNQTLILMDGRRLPSRSNGDSFYFQPDINGIPLAMIERIEILPSTASGIYGGGATGGVINIITRKDFSGAILNLNYTNTFDTDTAQRRADLTATYNLRGGATMLTLTASYTDANELWTQDRDSTARAQRLAFANNPSLFTDSFNIPYGYTTNIRSSFGSNLVLKNGTPLNAPSTYVPVGYLGTATDGGAALVANAGRYNLDLPDDASGNGRRSSLYTNASPTTSLGLSVRQKFQPWLEAYADYMTTRVEARSAGAGPSTWVTLDPSAPNNPFDDYIDVVFPIPNAPSVNIESVSTTARITGGLLAKLPREWQVGLDYAWSRSRINRRFNGANFSLPSGGLNFYSAVSMGEFDVLRDLNLQAPDYSPYFTQSTYDFDYGFITKSATARASGPVFALPAGPVTLSTSAEWRHDTKGSAVMTFLGPTASGLRHFWSPEISAEYKSLYAETRIPLLAAKAGKELAPARLELQLAARHETANLRPLANSATGFLSVPSTTGPFPTVTHADRRLSDTSFTAGFRFVPVPDLTLRASMGTGFLPPALSNLAATQPTNRTVTIVDPKRGNLSYRLPVTIIAGGNLNLRPEQSESFSGGLIYSPRQLPDFRLSIDYTLIRKTDEIGSYVFTDMVKYEDLFPGRVTRSALTAGDQALGYTGGVITQINASMLNFARREVEAVDFQLDYTKATGWGEFHPYVVATWTRHFDLQAVPDAPMVNATGFSDGPMTWRGNGGIDWRRGRWSAGWNVQYFDRQWMGYSTNDAGTLDYYALTAGFYRFPRQFYHDVQVRYQFGMQESGWRRWLAGTQLSVGVQNLFNKEAPLVPSELGPGVQPTTDPRLRRYSINLRKQF